MSSYRKYTFVFIFLLLLVVIFHAITWNTISKKVLLVDDNIYNGDLGRTSFKTDSIFPRPSYIVKESRTLKKNHIIYKDVENTKVDVITIGDSFSNAATQGINPYYQDYIATYNNYKVLNILPGLAGFIETISILDNSGLLDELKPKFIIIQSVERFCIRRFSQNIDLKKTINKKQLKKNLTQWKNFYQRKDPYINFINSQNFRAASFNIQRVLAPYGEYKFSILAPMEKDFFTSKDSNTLLFHKESLQNIHLSTEDNVKKLNDNFNALAKKLESKGIKLYFMPIVDKYNLYSKYIVDNKYPKSNFFERLRKLPKEYEFIDTKDILEKELDNGVKDLYYSDDTHWSYKASEVIFKKVKFE